MIWLATALANPWGATLEQVLDSCVIIKMDRTRPFDGNPQSSSEASGFVVDAERGLVMTNRHVVTTGPTRAFAIFSNQEEVDLEPVYTDPVHDFGLFRYDPAALEHVAPVSLVLAPEAARIGTEIRVIGNDAAEQLSILAGTLSRVDREAPYWDQNTFYLQAASSTSGGSSGSPVFDQQGRVVALNAGARNDAATSLFLPLERIQVALEAVAAGQVPDRGTAQVVLDYATYEELRRLGLTPGVEAERRGIWKGTGMLVVGRVNDGGPADGVLEPGDIVLSVQGEPVVDFVAWEAHLDGAVGEEVAIEVLRGGERVQGRFVVQDLHGMTPSAYLEIGEGLLHPVGYMQATRAGRPIAGVEVARAGRILAGAGVGTRDVITAIAGQPIRTLDDAIEVFAAIPDGVRVTLRHSPMNEPEADQVTTMRMDRSFWPVRRCARAQDGSWPCEDVAPGPEPTAVEPIAPPWRTDWKKKHRAVVSNLVGVRFRPHLNLDSSQGDGRESAGLLLDETGLVVTDRYAVPTDTGAVRVRFGDLPSVPARVLYRDPIRNVALVRIDMESVDLSAEWAFPELGVLDVERGVELLALDDASQLFRQELDEVRPRLLRLHDPLYPKYTSRNVEVLKHADLDRRTLGGVLVDRRGRVVGFEKPYAYDAGSQLRHAVWASDPTGVRLALERYARGDTTVRDLGVVLTAYPLADAREAGLPHGAAEGIRREGGAEPQVLRVRAISGDAPAADVLRTGDWLVGVGGAPLGRVAQLEEAVLAGPVALTVVRDLQTREVQVDPIELPIGGTDRAVLWSGVLVQEEPPEVALYWQSPRRGVYLSWYYGGSPAHRYGTSYSRRLLAIDGVEVRDLDHFLELVRGREDRSAVRLLLQAKSGKEWVSTLRLDQIWWPTELFERGPAGWTRRVVE